MTTIYLARHGQDEDNVKGILNGRRDMPLTEAGRGQAAFVANEIKQSPIRFDVVYASPQQRAFETAEIICSGIDGPKPIAEELLVERDFGIMTGKPISSIREECGDEHVIQAEKITYFLDPEGAETFPDLMSRARVLLDKVIKNHPDETVLLVTHGDTGKMIYAEYYHLDWKDVLLQFHFGNSELLLLSEDSSPADAHVFEVEQYNA